MSGGQACRTKDHRPRWRVRQRNQNRSAFNGGRATWSAWSEIVCLANGCPGIWRTKASYVRDIPDERPKDRTVFTCSCGATVVPAVAEVSRFGSPICGKCGKVHD